jgi:hypothetical protein
VSKSPRSESDWSSASEALFQAARSDHGPIAIDRAQARVRESLARRLGTAAGMGPVADIGTELSSTQAAQGLSLAKLVAISLGTATVIAGVLVFMQLGRHRSQPLTAAPAARTSELRVAAAPPELPGADSMVTPAGPAHSHSAPAARASSRRVRVFASRAQQASAREVSVQAPAPLPAAHTERSDLPPSPLVSVASAATTAREAAAPPPLPARSEPAARPAAAEAPAPEPSDARAEIALVRRIQAAMRSGTAANALALCIEHERRWPHGTFEQEREAVRAIAACDLHNDDAARRARAFLASYPTAALRPRVVAACKQQLAH